MDAHRPPTTEQRIKAAMELAGLNWEGLAERIGTPNYGPKTLYNMASPSFTGRVPRSADLHIIGRACGVSDAFWTVDFSKIEATDLRAEVRALDDRLSAALAQIAADVALLEPSLQEHHETDPQPGSTGDSPR
jgi:hypothetical protein